MSFIYKYYISYSSRNNVYSYKMFVYELWVRVVGHEMLWSRVACNSNIRPTVDFYSRWQRAIIGDFVKLSKKLFVMVCLKIIFQ